MPDVGSHLSSEIGTGRRAEAPPGAVLLGRIVRLQVQTDRLKPGQRPLRRYRVEPLVPVDELVIEPLGVHGVTPDGLLLDVHHPDHPRTRHSRPASALSLMSTADYAVLRETYGGHLVDGVAGESLLLGRDDPLAGLDLSAGVLVETADSGLLPVDDVRPATPCIEFCRFCVGDEPSADVSRPAANALAALDGGRRGYLGVPAGTGRVRVGAAVWLLPGDGEPPG